MPRFIFCHLPAFLLLSLFAIAPAQPAESREAMIVRVGDDIRYLASDELEGRGVETKGIHLAADHIIAAYKKYGLKPGMPDGTWKQTFDVSLGKTRIQSDTHVEWTDADGNTIRLDEDQFQPLQRGTNGAGKGELVFVGYGITSDDDNYDEYANVDVDGRVIVMIRREPRQGVEDGGFDGKKLTSHSYIDTKLELAKKHGAAGIIFVNDPYSVSSVEKDELSPSSGFGTNDSGIPFVHVKQAVVNHLLSSFPLKAEGLDKPITTVGAAAEYIDEHLKPLSQPLGGTASLTTRFNTSSVKAHNIIGVIEGSNNPDDETIVIGAHYDHLGYGGYGSRAKNRTGQIHYGADDNATGTAAVLEMIRRVTSGPDLKRRIVFICFSGEERGLLGSRHYVANPVYPLDKTVAMLNYDMIGTLRNNKIDVNGVGTAEEFRPIVEAADEASSLEIKIIESPFAGSDHLPFFQKQIPVMFCFTGITTRYHTPDDKFEEINVPGVVQVIDFTESLLRGIDALPKAPTFKSIGRRTPRPRMPFLGVIPNLGADADEDGIPLQSVRAGSPAAKAGLKPSDVVLKIDETSVDEYTNLVDFLKKAKSGQTVKLTVKRSDEEITLDVVLGAPR